MLPNWFCSCSSVLAKFSVLRSILLMNTIATPKFSAFPGQLRPTSRPEAAHRTDGPFHALERPSLHRRNQNNRGVEDVDLETFPLARNDARIDGNLALNFFGIEIGDRVAVSYAAAAYFLGCENERFRKGRSCPMCRGR